MVEMFCLLRSLIDFGNENLKDYFGMWLRSSLFVLLLNDELNLKLCYSCCSESEFIMMNGKKS